MTGAVPTAAGGKLLYSTSMSLDGFIAGPGGDMSWLTDLLVGTDEHPDPDVDGLVDAIGSILVGRTTFSGDDPNRGTDREGAYGGRWHGPVVVVTHHPDEIPPDPDVTAVADLDEAVAIAKRAAGDGYVNVLGANVAAQCIERGLLDEVLVIVAPILLGDGIRLFDHPGGARVRLEPIEPDRTGALAHWYRVLR